MRSTCFGVVLRCSFICQDFISCTYCAPLILTDKPRASFDSIAAYALSYRQWNLLMASETSDSRERSIMCLTINVRPTDLSRWLIIWSLFDSLFSSQIIEIIDRTLNPSPTQFQQPLHGADRRRLTSAAVYSNRSTDWISMHSYSKLLEIFKFRTFKLLPDNDEVLWDYRIAYCKTVYKG